MSDPVWASITVSHKDGFISQNKSIKSLQLPSQFPPDQPEFYNILEKDISHLLKIDAVPFWSTVVYNDSILAHIISFLNSIRFNNKINKLLLRLISRILLAPDEDDGVAIKAAFGSIDPITKWKQHIEPLAKPQILMDIAKHFNGSLQVVVLLIKSVFKHFPDTLLQLDGVTEAFSALTKFILSKQTNLSGSSKGKGKFSSPSSSSECLTLSYKHEDTLKEHAELLLDALDSLLSFSKAAGKPVVDALNKSDKFVASLLYSYDIANGINTITSLKGSQEQRQTFALKGKMIKRAALDLLYNLIQVGFLESFNCIEFNRLDDFILLFHKLIEESPVDSPCEYLQTAPILVDFDVKYDLLSSLNILKQLVIDHDSAQETRIDYLVQSLEILMETSANMSLKNSLRAAKTRTAVWVKEATPYTDPPPGYEQIPRYDQSEDSFAYRSSLITQVLDLFPELGEGLEFFTSGFIDALLQEFDDSTEAVIDRILSQDFPSHIDALDRSLPRQPMRQEQQVVPLKDSLVGQRANIFDGDEFDIFRRGKVDEERVILGKKDILSDVPETSSNIKQSILDLSYEDLYDDERDDTYDTNDIEYSGVADAGDDPSALLETESTHDPTLVFEPDLVAISQSNPELLERPQRKSKERTNLREKTGLTDEQLEGWYKMFLRNPNRQLVIEKYEFSGEQYRREIAKDVAAPTAKSTDKKYKDKNKARIGNHNRKRGHDKKMARGFGFTTQ